MERSSLIACGLLLDLEAGADRIHAIGAVFGDRTFTKYGRFDVLSALRELDSFAPDASFVAGHNLVHHDFPILQATFPALGLLRKPVIDTLYLSPLAFPQNPYHALVKDYKLVHDSLNDPTADARIAGRLLADEWDAFSRLATAEPALPAFYRYGLTCGALPDAGNKGMAYFFDTMGIMAPTTAEAESTFQRLATPWGCQTAIRKVFTELLPAQRIIAGYALAWLRVSGHNSVLPSWTRHRFPLLTQFLKSIRDAPCTDQTCAYCRNTHDPRVQLKTFFGWDEYRPTPTTADGRSMQEAVVVAGMGSQPLLAILPTGGGKSLCYQVPALAHSFRRGLLTVVISPLQALMKDQVDNLISKTGFMVAGALNGLLTPPERGETLERVRMGDIAILYVSPEQLRNKSFHDTVRHREIACWVFDEAHCLSKWGHDFRPDYVYASRFIREFAKEQGTRIPPVACFTATAKQDVVDEILDHFRVELAQELHLFTGTLTRENLQFEVRMVSAAEKQERVHDVLSERLPGSGGSAVVYTATRARAEETADFLVKKGWAAAAFHAGLTPPEKRRIQDEFVGGRTPIICATNAFGMGIDKDNVRLVVHVDIPGSLENYIQEAGRAGRDRAPAQCVLLYDEQDVETQFGLGAMSKLSQRDIIEILRGLRRARRNAQDEIVITAGEILRDEEVHTEFGSADRNADTKVRTAIAVLEKSGFVERNQNQTRVFQGRPLVRNMDEAAQRVNDLKLSPRRRSQWMGVLERLMNADPDVGMSADELAEMPQFRPPPAEEGVVREAAPVWGRQNLVDSDTTRVLQVLNEMADAGLIKKDLMMTAFVRPKGVNNSRQVMERVGALERGMLAAMQEETPDPEGWLVLSLRRLNQRLTDEGHVTAPEVLARLLQTLSFDGRGAPGQQGSMDLRPVARDQYRVKLHRDWTTLQTFAERRRALAGLALETILSKAVAEASPSGAGDTLVAFSADDVLRAMAADLVLGAQIKDRQAALEHALMYLHEQHVLILQQGLAVFRQAMTIRILPDRHGDRFTKGDYSALDQHYQERVFQVHVMNEYARLALDKVRQALALVAAYFTVGKEEFVRRYFSGRQQLIERATSAESYRRIVDELRNASQVSIVAAKESENMLVLAGPGSGKTRAVAHRCAFLLRVERVPARAILVLCFNRNAALTLRRRLLDLVGADARGVTVSTYHSLAMRLIGASFAERAQRRGNEMPDFEDVIERATRLLKGDIDLPGLEKDELRDRLLAGYRHILVDEYQDIDAGQYDLVSAIAGRTRSDSDSKLSIMAVGDDDQSIYGWRGANVDFIRRFAADYNAKAHYLVENYRSTAHIVAAANQLIARNRDRMKTSQPIRVNQGRRMDDPGGRWARLDPVGLGRVQALRVADAGAEALAAVAEMERMRTLDPRVQWADFAVLARTAEELASIRALCEHRQIPVIWNADRDNLPPLHRIREIAAFLDELKDCRSELRRASDLEERLAQITGPRRANPWFALLHEILSDYREDSANAEAPVGLAVEFIYDALADRRREHFAGSGVFLATVHAAKGTEFRHVVVMGGGWPVRDPSEDERRVYYVGMTRAQETLCLLDRRDVRNPFAESLSGDFVFRRDCPPVSAVDAGILNRRYELIGMADVYLDMAGRRPAADPIHRHIAALQPGDSLKFQRERESLYLVDATGERIAKLSQGAYEKWTDRVASVDSLRVTAIVTREAADCADPNYAALLRVPAWGVPLAEVTYHL